MAADMTEATTMTRGGAAVTTIDTMIVGMTGITAVIVMTEMIDSRSIRGDL